MNNLEYSLIFRKGLQSYHFYKDENEQCFSLDHTLDYDLPIKSKEEDSKKIYQQLQNLLKGHLTDLIVQGLLSHQFQKDNVYLGLKMEGIEFSIVIDMSNPNHLKNFIDKFKDLTNMTFDEFLSLKGLTVNSLKGTYKFLNNAIIGNTDKGIRRLKDLTPTFPDFDKKLFRMPVKIRVEYSPDMDNLELLKYLISSVRWESGQEKSLLTRYRLKIFLVMSSHNNFLPMYGFSSEDNKQILHSLRVIRVKENLVNLIYIQEDPITLSLIDKKIIPLDKEITDKVDPLLLEIFLNHLRFHYTTYLTHVDFNYRERQDHQNVERIITGIWYDINEKRVGKKEVDK